MCFPRWLAVAETAWNGGSKVGYSNFLNATRFYCDILKEMKVNFELGFSFFNLRIV